MFFCEKEKKVVQRLELRKKQVRIFRRREGGGIV